MTYYEHVITRAGHAPGVAGGEVPCWGQRTALRASMRDLVERPLVCVTLVLAAGIGGCAAMGETSCPMLVIRVFMDARAGV